MDFNTHGAYILGLALLLGSAVITPIFAGQRKFAGWLNAFFCLGAALAFAGVAGSVLMGSGQALSFTIRLGAFSVPFLIDGFSSLFLCLIALMATLTAVYCIGYMEMAHYRRYGLGGFLFAYPLFVAGMIGIVTVDDLTVGFTVAWQMMTLASWFLIRFDNQDRAIVRSANKYLLLMELAWGAVITAALLIPEAGAGTPLHALTEGIGKAPEGLRFAIYGLLLFGFAMKAGMFPLGQLWLPDAHSSAPSPISALLSGVMIKTGVYGIVRTLFWMVPSVVQANEGRYLGLALASFGVVTLFIGTVQALKQHDAKRLHAYHSIGQMGYILLGIGTAHYFFLSASPLLHILAVLALIGALCHTINHALFKGLLFLCTGSVQYATGTKDLDKLGGLLKLMPLTALTAAIASASIAGIPAFSGFMSKWAIIAGGLVGGKTAGIIVLFGIIALMTSAITLASYVKFFGMAFTASGIEWGDQGEVREVGALMLLPKLVLSVLCIIQGLFPVLFVGLMFRVFATSPGALIQPLFNDPATVAAIARTSGGIALGLNGSGTPVAFMMPLALVAMLFVAGFFAAWLRAAGGGEKRVAPVWLCGYQLQNNANHYLSSHIYAAFKKLMRWTGGNVHKT